MKEMSAPSQDTTVATSSANRAVGQMANTVSDDWYLKVYSLPERSTYRPSWKAYRGLLGTRWLKVALAVTVGLCIGLGFAAFRSSEPENVEVVSSRPSLPTSGPEREHLDQAQPMQLDDLKKQSDASAAEVQNPMQEAAEVERLKVRNRRLEALISVFKQRTKSKRSTPTPPSNEAIQLTSTR